VTKGRCRNRDKLSYTLLRLMVVLSEVDKRTRNYGTDRQLHEAEIHTIAAVKENPGAHVTGIAEALGVTKGAVSQILLKLQKKGMIAKESDAGNRSRLIVRLTPTGETAYANHERLHREFDGMVSAVLREATEENKAFLKGFLESLEERLDKL
jgi:DNA-binding MarR family transcriptional regulator